MQKPNKPNIQYYDDGSTIKSINTKTNYVTSNTKETIVRRDVTGIDSGYELGDGAWDPVEVTIKNGRPRQKTLDEHGYQLIDSKINKNIDFMDTNDVIDKYYPECEQLLKDTLVKNNNRIADVKAFDHNIRITSDTFGPELKGGVGSKAQFPLGMVHADYTTVSSIRRVEDLAKPPKANDVLKRRLGNQPLLNPTMVDQATKGRRRFAIVNVWRNIDTKHPVQEFPLACMDAHTTTPKDYRIFKLHYVDRIGENYFLTHSKTNEWHCFLHMTSDETLLIKTWDSKGQYAVTTPNNNTNIDKTTIAILAFHSAFLDPSSPPNSPRRQSIEVRCVVIWDAEDDAEEEPASEEV
jgi:hypothetical protein